MTHVKKESCVPSIAFMIFFKLDRDTDIPANCKYPAAFMFNPVIQRYLIYLV